LPALAPPRRPGETHSVPPAETAPQLLIATNNPGKVRELRRLLDGCGFDVLTPGDLSLALEVEETGTTYAENATLKARAFAAAAGILALADDSGIEVDALGGAPGVYSARYGGPGLDDAGRVQWLLHDLRGRPHPARGARYRAIVAVAEPAGGSGTVVTFEGVQEGYIACTPRGEGGFGYDPIFLVDPWRTQAELSPEEKDVLSHRGKAVRAARAYLRAQVR